MKKGIRLLVAVNWIFLVLMSLSSCFDGVVGELLYLLAFTLPFCFGWLGARRLRYEREEERGLSETDYPRLGIDASGARLVLPLIAPTVAAVFLVALLTSLLLNFLGASSAPVADEPIWKMLLVHALAPALLEEMLFRYIPLKVLYPYSPRAAVLLSSLFFALIHLDLYKMPYAFIAGVIFALADVITGSVLPSLAIHLLNNASSLLLMKYGASPAFTLWFYITLGALVIVSVAFLVIYRKKYRDGIRNAFSGVMQLDASVLVISLTCATIALFNIVG
ncbi:MAG: CPBP family intramembrane metalloprotease [Clostridia bacterium]|nr:CPBP family intramembrane metalloprotease [Clostridia bacterium]